MIGNNTLILNSATMVEAVQMWLNSEMGDAAPLVTSVQADGDSISPTFRVELQSPTKVITHD